MFENTFFPQIAFSSACLECNIHSWCRTYGIGVCCRYIYVEWITSGVVGNIVSVSNNLACLSLMDLCVCVYGTDKCQYVRFCYYFLSNSELKIALKSIPFSNKCLSYSNTMTMAFSIYMVNCCKKGNLRGVHTHIAF